MLTAIPASLLEKITRRCDREGSELTETEGHGEVTDEVGRQMRIKPKQELQAEKERKGRSQNV